MAGKVAIVTGGNAGIGEAVAKLFAQEGASVVITGRRQGELDRVVEAIAHAKGKAISVAGSVTDEAHARETMGRALETYGRIDAVVNNAGIGDFGKRLHEVDDATWSHVLDVNVNTSRNGRRLADAGAVSGSDVFGCDFSSCAWVTAVSMSWSMVINRRRYCAAPADRW